MGTDTIADVGIRDRARTLRQRWPEQRRLQVAATLAILAIFVATVIASSRLLRYAFDDLDIFAYIGLFIACWVGAGGALVPVPGVRPISWLMVIQQAAALNPWTVAVVAATAMALGQSSYFLATRAAIARHEKSVASGDEADSAVEEDPTVEDETTEPEEPSGRAAVVIRMKHRVDDRVHRHATSTAFLTTMLPSPLTTIATTASASAGTRYPRWLAPAFLGYLLFATVLAVVGQGLLTMIRGIRL